MGFVLCWHPGAPGAWHPPFPVAAEASGQRSVVSSLCSRDGKWVYSLSRVCVRGVVCFLTVLFVSDSYSLPRPVQVWTSVYYYGFRELLLEPPLVGEALSHHLRIFPSALPPPAVSPLLLGIPPGAVSVPRRALPGFGSQLTFISSFSHVAFWAFPSDHLWFTNTYSSCFRTVAK